MNDEKMTFKVMDETGREVECEVLFTFESTETKKNYVVYTDNTTDESGSTRVYASIYDATGADKSLKPIESEQEWDVIENILSSIQEKVDSEESQDN